MGRRAVGMLKEGGWAHVYYHLGALSTGVSRSYFLDFLYHLEFIRIWSVNT